MDDLIRRREVIAALGERPLVWVGSDYGLGARNQYDCDRLAVETTPTVDAVEVVMCKDCIRYLKVCERWGRCQIIPYRLRKDDFCSYGLRKDGEGI